MTNAATARVINSAAADIEQNKQVVGPLVSYAAQHFPNLDERMRFMALVMFASAQYNSRFAMVDIVNEIPSAINDIAKEFALDPEPNHTVH